MDFIYFLGRLHVLALHLPIGIICVLFVLEWLARKEKHQALAGALPFLWGATAVTAIGTVVLGYMHFAEGSFTGPSAYLHRNFGTAVAVFATAVGALRMSRFGDAYKPVFFPAAALLLFLVSITGHYGGNLTHGSSFLVEYAPQPLRSLAGLPPRRHVESLAAADPFLDVVAPMLEQRCGSCHNADKRESDLDLTSYERLMRGGESGRVVYAGAPERSELLSRITLPPSDESFMPAEGKTPLTDAQVEIVEWWIGAGAPHSTTLGELDLSPEAAELIRQELGVDS
jgi:uncharacterized membrane protein